MYRVVYELVIHGLPEELKCIARFNESLNSIGKCVGSSSSFICGYGKALIKLIPYQPQQISISVIQQSALTVSLQIESDDVDSLLEAANYVYSFFKDCGVLIRLVS